MKPSKVRRNREELQKEAEANFIPEDAENPFLQFMQACRCDECNYRRDTGLPPREHRDIFSKPKLPCHVPNCQSPECDRFHEGDDQ